jgi:DNA repair exonuclease SbcCD ATPase subunit
MILKKCYIENFGRLHKFSYDFQKGLNIIQQENGWGKTTLSVFIKSMFYGLPATRKNDLSQNQRKKYSPWQGGKFGGYIEFEMGGKAYRIERFFGKTESQDTFALYDLATNKPSDDYSSMIGYEIFRLDEDAYERSTFFPQANYKTGINDSIRAKLTNLIEDEDDIAGFSQAIESLKVKKSMFEKRGNKGIIADLEDKQIDLQEQLQECLNRQEQNIALRKRLNELEQEQLSLKNQADELSQKIDQIKENRVYKEIYETYTRYKNDFDRASALYDSMRLEFKNRLIEQDEVDSLHKKIVEVNQSKQALRECEQNLSTQNTAQTKPNNLGLLIMIISALVAAGGIGALFFNIILGSVLIGAGLLGIIAGFLGLKNFKKQDASLKTLKERINTINSQVKNDLNYITNSLKSYYSDVNEYNYYEVYNDFKYNAKLFFEKQKDMEDKRQVLLDYMEEKQLDDQKIQLYASLQYDYSREQNELNIINQRLELIKSQIFDLKAQISQNQAYVIKIEELKSKLEQTSQDLKEARYYNETLKLTMDYLTKARETLTQNYLDKMEKSCSKYMSRFETKDSFSIDTDLAVMIEKSGERKELDYFSEGYKDIVGLCTRLALVDVMFEREKPFLILDDPFVNLDDLNLERAKNIIYEIAKNYQVIYLICHTSRAQII